MDTMVLTEHTISDVKEEIVIRVKDIMGTDLVESILYGSCARGDYTHDSDIDIALLTRCDRMGAKKYDNDLARISTDLAMKYFVIVNFVCLPYEEFEEKKTWYAYFKNIEREGEVLYG